MNIDQRTDAEAAHSMLLKIHAELDSLRKGLIAKKNETGERYVSWKEERWGQAAVRVQDARNELHRALDQLQRLISVEQLNQ